MQCQKSPDKQCRPRSDCLKKQSDQGLHCLPFWQAFCEFQPWNENRKRSVWNFRTFTTIWIELKKFFMPPKELWEAYSNHTVRQSVRQSVRPSVRPSVPLHVRSISPIFFEVGIPNLVCECILGWRSVAYHFRVTVTLTLTSDLVFWITVSGAYLLYYLR